MEKEKIVGIIFVSIIAIFLLIDQNPFASKEEKFQESILRTRDLAYIEWIGNVSNDIEQHIKPITDPKDSNSAELHARLLKEQMQYDISKTEQLQTSPGLEPLTIEFKKYLKDYYNTGRLIEIGIKNDDSDSMNKAINYSKDGYGAMEDISKIVEDYMKKNNVKIKWDNK